VLQSLKATTDTKISVLGHDGEILEYAPQADPAPKFLQLDDGLHLDIMLAQRIYNNSLWPNPVVVKLTAVLQTKP
jgi:alpha-L-fucosidase